MNNKAEMGPIDKEQKKVIEDLEDVLNFLKSAQIKDEDDLDPIKKPLNDLRSSLKFIPTDPYFEIIPTEIKTKILSYLCDTNAFTAASVCVEWKAILASRFTEKRVTIGQRCCSCKSSADNLCLNNLTNSAMLKAAATHRLDVHLSISHSVREVDSKLFTDALTSVSRFSLLGYCTCDGYENEVSDDSYESNSTDYECDINPLSIGQLKDLFNGLEKKMETMEQVKLECLDLNELNQDRLVHCFVNKIKNLTLREDNHHNRMFNVKTFLNKLSQESAQLKLNQLTLDVMKYPEEFSLELANAVCNVENVKIKGARRESLTQLIENIVTDTHPVMIKTLIICESIDFRTLINSEDLKKLCNKLVTLRLKGIFTVEQREATKSLPGVQVEERFRTLIKKGFNIF